MTLFILFCRAVPFCLPSVIGETFDQGPAGNDPDQILGIERRKVFTCTFHLLALSSLTLANSDRNYGVSLFS